MPGFDRETLVLIIGGDPVGLGLAADLGMRGTPCLLVEQTDGTIDHPRANTVNSRTMEFCRRWGIAKEVRESAAPPDPLAVIDRVRGA
jgi:2-polyprenyl-6-methoxyphenol hydroxylase-like FAD-dependent oxidoreductase